MTRNELNAKLAAIITTLAEVEFAPESMIYLAIGADINQFNQLKTMLCSAGLVTSVASTMRLTAAGQMLSVKINASIHA